ncbi:hypothetical protein [Mycetocola sp. 2940]|uniref:hypothetical protein n=1 Tax=Mycetocola sp. 2940 TaxID=3156452 RepID=UPI00339B174F
MIINSGWDFLFLAKEHLWQDEHSRKLVVIAADDDLEHYFTEVVTDTYNGLLDEYHDAILAAVDVDYVRYFALAQESAPRDTSDLDYEMTRRLKTAAAARGLQLISHLYVAQESWCSTGPVHRLSEYVHAGDEYPIVRIERPPRYPQRRRAPVVKLLSDP